MIELELWYMADVHDKATRSKNMAAIRGKDTKPEMLVRRFLHKHGFRYRLHVKDLPGKPDIVLPKYKTVVDIHGCYFHRHPGCRYCTTPSQESSTNWKKKFSDTVRRDKRNKKALQDAGWKVLTVWECETKAGKLQKTLAKLPGKIVSSRK
ncbi:very short patch repair endonuclease [Aridibaculum aurantiacum]|uniref:very short patch repair endonuclease n=1 Tax=Aridibaculum aurantiacum TaxID=2810307 RepID=UPI001F60CCC1|nr:DNA mismatch endonuclease Vsr [Aridibaculum aurantiacum]